MSLGFTHQAPAGAGRLGGSVQSVDFDEFDTISGEAVYRGIGADFLISKNHAINFTYRVSDWDEADDVFDYDISNSYIGVACNFRFSPLRRLIPIVARQTQTRLRLAVSLPRTATDPVKRLDSFPAC